MISRASERILVRALILITSKVLGKGNQNALISGNEVGGVMYDRLLARAERGSGDELGWMITGSLILAAQAR